MVFRKAEQPKPKWFRLLLAPQKGFGPPTFRLGGGCSIQLSYWGITNKLYRKKLRTSTENLHILRNALHILSGRPQKGGSNVRESDDPNTDLEDLIFDEEAGGPSQR